MKVSFILLVASMAIAGTLAAQEPDAVIAPVQIEVSAGPGRFALGEPIYLAVTLSNSSNQIQTVSRVLSPAVGNLSIRILRPDATETPGILGGFLLVAPSAYVDLSPGDSTTSLVPIFLAGSGWVFDEAGDYRISVTYHSSSEAIGAVAAQEIRITIENDPGGEYFVIQPAVEQAAQILIWHSAAPALDNGRDLLAEVIKRFPDSAISAHARVGLAMAAARGFASISAERARPSDCRVVETYLLENQQAAVPPLLRLQANLAQIGCGKIDLIDDSEELLKTTRGLEVFQPQLDAFKSENVNDNLN